MKVLIACEESQTVCVEFRRLGHEAYSSDILEPSGQHKEWHILGDSTKIIDGNCKFCTMDGETHEINGRWDLIIAHPPMHIHFKCRNKIVLIEMHAGRKGN